MAVQLGINTTYRMNTHEQFLHFFNDSLWKESAFGSRSGECSPLYVDRYSGPRSDSLRDIHDWWELTAVVEGAIRLSESPLVTADSCVLALVAPGTAHGEQSANAETVWVGFRGSRMQGVERQYGPLITARSPTLTGAVEQLWLFARQRGGAIGPELDAMTARLVAAFLRLASEQRGAVASTDWAETAVAHIEQHLAEPASLPELARRFGCSEGHFCRVFKARTGYAPIPYILRARVGRAVHLLKQTRWPVAEIGRAVGFENPFYFSRVFRKIQGQSPLQYRQDQRHARSIHQA